MTNPDWIVIHDATCGDLAWAIECRRCGAIQKVATPITIDCLAAFGKAFGKTHQHCKEPDRRGNQWECLTK